MRDNVIATFKLVWGYFIVLGLALIGGFCAGSWAHAALRGFLVGWGS